MAASLNPSLSIPSTRCSKQALQAQCVESSCPIPKQIDSRPAAPHEACLLMHGQLHRQQLPKLLLVASAAPGVAASLLKRVHTLPWPPVHMLGGLMPPQDSGAGSEKIPDSGDFGKQGVLNCNAHCLSMVLIWILVVQTCMLLPAIGTKLHQDVYLLMSATQKIKTQAIVVAA